MTAGILMILLFACLWFIFVQQAEIASLTKALNYADAQLKTRHPAYRGLVDDDE